MAKNIHCQTIITAAGDDLRYKKPKRILGLNLLNPNNSLSNLNKSFLSYSLQSKSTVVALSDNYVNIVQNDKKSRKNLSDSKIVAVPHNAKGALISALFATGELQNDEPVVICAGNSEIRGGIKPYINDFIEKNAPAGTIVFEGSGPLWSYLDIDINKNVRQVAEKVQVSNLATTGVFYFSSVELFRSAAKWCLINNIQINDKFYVSSALNYLLHERMKLEWIKIESNLYKRFSSK